MMRRSRISVKPNFRPGNRTGTEGQQVSQGVSEAGGTLPAVEAEEVLVGRPGPSHQENVALIQRSEDVGMKDAPEIPSTMNQNNGAPSSGATTSSAAPQRRMRISAAPKLHRPKLTSAPRTRPCASIPSSAPSPLPNEEHDSVSEAQASDSVISNDLPKSGTPRKSTSPTKPPVQSSTRTQPSSPCVPSTSGLQKSPVHRKKSLEDSPPSPQPGQVPKQPSQKTGPSECPSSSDLSSVSIKHSHFDKACSSEMTDKSLDTDRILKALKLKELMKIERRKDIQMERRRAGPKQYTALDRSKMTMRDLIYYLPNTSPLRRSVVHEENEAETIIPPSPKQQIKTAEKEEEEEEAAAESENEEMLVPKVRVAADGSIVLDEESLTVRVQRSSNTKLVEESNALFERGSTTTYSSFRTLNYVKSWSVRETDLFFLAISMVGTDFSLIGRLLTNRSRAAIKNKFKKEEKVNPWRIDKAMRNKRPYDKEFFSYLLEKVLAKDQDKRNSVKLILPKTRQARKSKGKTSNKMCVKRRSGGDDDDDDDDSIFYMDDHDLDDDDDRNASVEKENENTSNVKESDPSVPAKKKCKRTRDVSKDKDNDTTTEDQAKRKRQRKCVQETTKEVHTKDDIEGESNLNVEGDAININKEDELERSTSASKRRRKCSKSVDETQNEKPVKGTKAVCDQEESVTEHEESSIMDEDGCATEKKRKRTKSSDLDGDEPAKKEKNTKRKKALKSTVEKEGNAEVEASSDLQEAEKLNAPVMAEVADNVPPKVTRQSRRLLPNLAIARGKKSNEPETTSEVERESHDENNHESILTTADSPLEDERLRMQAVVVLEKTPPRQQNLLSPSKVHCKNNELEPSVSSPASPLSSESGSSQQTKTETAGRVKCNLNLSAIGQTGRRKGMMDQDEAEPKSPTVLLESITQEAEEVEENDNSLNENLDFSCLRDLDSQMFQRRPMVALSREEVDMILNASDQSADEDPSLSPLDLSLNTELSLPLQCSKLLEDNDEEAEVERVFEGREERTNESASCEERNGEELEPTDSALAQPDISNLRDISASLKPEVCSQPEEELSKIASSCPMEEAEPQVHPIACKDVITEAAVLEDSLPLIVLDNVEPIDMKLDAPVTQETITSETTTLGTSLVVSDVMEKTVPPALLKDTVLTSSEIAVQSKLTSVGSGLESPRSPQATLEAKGELQTSLEEPSQTMETLQSSSESQESTQESAEASSEIKARMQGCAVIPEIEEKFQEEVSVQSSSASISSEHDMRPPRRSKSLKPKPNLSQKPRASVLQNRRRELKAHGTLKPESSEPTVLTEKVQHGALEEFSKESLTKEETSQSKAVEQMESESTEVLPDLSDASTAVPDQENVMTVTLSPASADEPQVASEDRSRCDDVIPPCTTVTLAQPSQTRDDTSAGQMIVPSEDVCAPAEILHLTEDGQSDEEPIFILTLYEIPVTQAYLPSSSNDSAMTSDLPTVEPQSSLGFSDQTHTPSPTSELTRIDSLPNEGSGTEKACSQNDLGVATEDFSEKCKEQISVRAISHELASPHTKDEDSNASENLEMGIPPLDPNSECKKSSEFAPLDDLAPRIQSTPSGYSVSKCITPLLQDSEDPEQGERVSHTVPADVCVPALLETRDDSSKSVTMAVEGKLHNKEGSSVGVGENFAENIEKDASHEPILLATEDEESDACANLKTGISHKDPDSECKKGSEFALLEDLASRTQSTSGFNISKCITALPEDSEDTEQSERVSPIALADVFDPVSEETRDDSGKERTMTDECKLHSEELSSVSLPERQDTPYEELTKVENLPAVSCSLLCPDSIEESKATAVSSEEKKAPARRRARQIKPQPKLVKRAHAKDDSSKTDQLVKKPSQPTSSPVVVLPASHEENLAGVSNTSNVASGDGTSSLKENKASVSRGKEVKPKSVAEKSPKISQCGLEHTESNPISTALHLSKEGKLKEENRENVMGDATNKEDLESSVEDKESSILTSSEGADVQPSSEDVRFSLMMTSGAGSSTVDSEETEAETHSFSHMVLPNVFVLVSDETEDDLSNNSTVSMESSPQRVNLPKKPGAHSGKELKTEDVSQTLTEESTQNQSPLVDVKTPVRKRGKEEVVRECPKTDLTKPRPSQPASPQTTTPSSQLTTLPQNEKIVLPEEKLQRRHQLMPCSVKLSRLDIAAHSLKTPEPGDRKCNSESTVTSSPTCHASVTTSSEESPSLSEEMKLEDSELKKSLTRRKGKKTESSQDTKHGHLKPVQAVSQTRQLTVTDLAKKTSHHTAKNLEEKEPVKSSQMQSSFKAKEGHQLLVEKTCSKSQHTDSEEPEGSHIVPALEKTEEASNASEEVKRSSQVVLESTDGTSVSQVKQSPVRQRAKLQVKPVVVLKRVCTKSEGNISTTDQPQSTRFTSPTRQHVRAAREKESSNNETKQPVKEISNASSSMEGNSKSTESSLITSGPQSPISQGAWPRVVLPRVKLWTTEAGVCSASSTPTSSPTRVSQSASPPVTPPQVKKSPTQRSSPTVSENSDDDPSRVSQFFLSDIFTEVEDAE